MSWPIAARVQSANGSRSCSGRPIGDEPLDRALLGRRQRPLRPHAAAPPLRREGLESAGLEPIPPATHGHVVDAEQRADLDERLARLPQADRRAALLFLRGRGQRASIASDASRHHAIYTRRC